MNRLLYYIYGYVHAGALDEQVMIKAIYREARESVRYEHHRFLGQSKTQTNELRPVRQCAIK